MSSDLDLLVDFYQWEKQRLLLEIDENKRDHDYIAVHYANEQLRHIQLELECLLELQNANYQKIQRLKRNIESFSERENSLGYFVPQIDQYKKELEDLKKERTIDSEETQILDEAIFSLINKEIEGFTIYFDLKKESYIDAVIIETGQIQLRLMQESPYGNDLNFLKKYVFMGAPRTMYDESTKSLVTYITMNRYKNVLPIKETISRIVIGSKYWLGLGDTIFLKLKP
ncbi:MULTISPECIES: hypothetical protein [unclassified Flagellimonas]|uniref:Uncharacterized protein n=1 Tax=Flagellimonas sp. MMG031 TaxID=3158549 RepID=A0AAU7N0C4_9FLAO